MKEHGAFATGLFLVTGKGRIQTEYPGQHHKGGDEQTGTKGVEDVIDGIATVGRVVGRGARRSIVRSGGRRRSSSSGGAGVQVKRLEASDTKIEKDGGQGQNDDVDDGQRATGHEFRDHGEAVPRRCQCGVFVVDRLLVFGAYCTWFGGRCPGWLQVRDTTSSSSWSQPVGRKIGGRNSLKQER